MRIIEFQDRPPTFEEIDGFTIPMKEDLYAPLLKQGTWIFKEN